MVFSQREQRLARLWGATAFGRQTCTPMGKSAKRGVTAVFASGVISP